MKNIVTILLVIFVLLQVLNLDFDNLFNLTINKTVYINIIVAVLCLIGYLREKKQS